MTPPQNAPLRARLREQGWAWLLLVALCGGQWGLFWLAMGGWAGLMNEWPPLLADHGLHFTFGTVVRDCLREGGFTAGYDPRFMAGFATSVVASSFTLVDVTMFLFQGIHPAVVYKLTVWVAIALTPVLIAWAGFLVGLSTRGVVWGIGLFLVYFWSDFPVYCVAFGMVSFLLAIPMGLVAVALLAGYLERGGGWRWASVALACSLTFFAHPTSPMVVGVAGLVAYALAWTRSHRGRLVFPRSRHLGFWSLAPVILVVNEFWWLPGYWLRATVGETAITFAHPEPVLGRLAAIFWNEPVIEPVLIGFGVVGLLLLGSFRPVAAAGVAGLVAAGFGWGYLAGAFRTLDGLQPGRQTYACYSGLCLAAGYALGELMAWLRTSRPGRLDRWLTLGIFLIGVRIFGPSIAEQIKDAALGPTPLLTSEPLPALIRLVDHLHRHIKPGERLLYEESGRGIPGLEDPFAGRHFSPILPLLTGVEMLGGPYLHNPLTTNFTQFGEEKLFGTKNWDRNHFIRYARLYRPTAIACWTPKARAFCQANPDLIQVLEDDPVILLGRVVGFEGSTITGQAIVDAGPNRLTVREMIPNSVGLVVLRYHWTPHLVADPVVPLEPIFEEADPVPFIGLRPTQPGPVTIRLRLPPRAGWFSSSTEGN